MTQFDLTLAIGRCILEHPFEIEYYDTTQCFIVILHEPVLMNWSLERILMLGGFLSLAAGFDKEIRLIFDANRPL